MVTLFAFLVVVGTEEKVMKTRQDSRCHSRAWK